MADTLLQAHDLWKTYDGRTDVLRGVELEVATGEAALIWGDNGSGKTTLLSLLGGLDAPTRGQVTLAGRVISDLPERALSRVRLRDIGFVFQTHHLLEDLTVEENVALPLRLARRPSDSRVRELLEAFGLQKLAARKPDAISVGESQRVAIARSLANAPKVILADEPTASLDAKGMSAVVEALALARTSFGAAEVVAAHDAEVRALATREYLLEDGRLRARG